MKKKVHVVGGDSLIEQMFLNRGWVLVSSPLEADLVQFTGGSDVTPSLYGEEVHPTTSYDTARDREEMEVYAVCVSLGKPMAGICRGGQFLNVMCGGAMWQNVNYHAIAGTHIITDTETGEKIPATSTHHQMMYPAKTGDIFAVAAESTWYEDVQKGLVNRVDAWDGEDVEVVFYESQKALCFQPHPEYMDKDSRCQDYYFELMENHLELPWSE